MSRPGLSLRGQVAQAEEHGSSGSSGVGTASGLGPEDRGFETLLPDSVVSAAQCLGSSMAEPQFSKLVVEGSIPSRGSMWSETDGALRAPAMKRGAAKAARVVMTLWYSASVVRSISVGVESGHGPPDYRSSPWPTWGPSSS